MSGAATLFIVFLSSSLYSMAARLPNLDESDQISASVTASSARCLGRDRYLNSRPFLFGHRNKRNIRSTYQTLTKRPQHPSVDIQDPPVSPGVQISGNSYDRTRYSSIFNFEESDIQFPVIRAKVFDRTHRPEHPLERTTKPWGVNIFSTTISSISISLTL
jgi:hypothetical protein